MNYTHQHAEDFMNNLPGLAADLIDRLSRIETTLTALDKTVRGNGVPGLMGRVDALESAKDIGKGRSSMKTKVTGFAMAIIIALLGAGVSLSAVHDSREQAAQTATTSYMQRQDTRLNAVEVDVAVLMAGLKGQDGEKGDKGQPGAQGAKGDAGAKGGIKLFGH